MESRVRRLGDGGLIFGTPPLRVPGGSVAAALLLLILGSVLRLNGQSQSTSTVLGTVTQGSTGEPVNGAFVTLLDSSGERLSGTLSDESGRYVLRGVLGPDLQLRVERIGLETARSESFALAPGDVLTRDFTVRPAAVALEGLAVEVSSSRRCSLDDRDASSTVRLWEEARKALEVAQWVDEVGYRYEVRNFSRRLDRSGRTLRERRVRETTTGQAAFASLDPDSLAARGFVQRDGDGWAFYAPDAETLLSDSFLATHCFETVRDGGRLGLGFEPARSNALPEVKGTLWFGSDGRLDRVEFRYIQLDDDLASLDGMTETGGEVRFALLEEGAWVVQDWRIRMPSLGLSQGSRRRSTEVIGYSEVGGRILSAQPARADRTVFGDRTGAVTGRVIREGDGSGAAHASVFLSGTGYAGRTSEDGSFLLDQVQPGDYRLVVRHPALDSLGLTSLAAPVSVEADGFAPVSLVIPGHDQLLVERCQELDPVPLAGWEDENGGSPVHAGGVVQPPPGQDAPGWPVRIRWTRRGLGATGGDIRERWAGAELRTGSGGAWTFCHLPVGVEVQLSWARRSPEAEGGGRVVWGAWQTLGRPRAGESYWRVLTPGR